MAWGNATANNATNPKNAIDTKESEHNDEKSMVRGIGDAGAESEY